MRVLKGKSGITVLFRPMDTGLVDFRYVVKCGAVDEGPSEWGLAHALEHTVFSGTEKRDWLKINRDWEKLGAVYNAFTGHDKTVFHATCLKQEWQEVYEILADVFYNCKFPQDRWEEIEKPAIISEIQSDLEDGDSILCEELYSRGIGNRYHSILGDLETIKSATITDLTKFYDMYYQGNNVFLLITGDLTESQLLRLVNKHDKLAHKSLIKRKPFDFTFNYAPIAIHKTGTKQAYIQSLAPIGTPRSFRTRLALDVGINCLSQYLFEELREKRGLVYEAAAGLYWDIPGNLFLQAKTASDPGIATKTQKAFVEALGNFIHKGLTSERIENMQKRELYFATQSSESIHTSAAWMWDAWEEGQIKRDPYATYIKVVEELSVESIRSTTRLHMLGERKIGKVW